MPIYELECTKCGLKEEKLFTTIVNFLTPAEAKKRKRPKTKYPELQPKCSSCRGPQVLIPSLTSMQPDKYWSGQVVHGKYVTSKKQIDRDIEPATREKMEWVNKQKRKRHRDHAQKSAKNLRNFLTTQLADVTIEPDGASVKERTDYERARGRNYSGSSE